MDGTALRARFVESGVLRLAAYERGDPSAPTVLLVHGYPDTHALWDEVATALAARYHVVSYDVRGAGASDSPRPKQAYRLSWLARDLKAVARAVSPDRPVHLVGHDWGSIQAWEPVTEPGAADRIASYTSISGPCLDHIGHWLAERHDRPTPHALRQLLSQYLHSWYVFAFHLPAAAPATWRLGLARQWRRVLHRLEGVTPRAGHPAPTLADDAVRGIRLYRANVMPRIRHPRDRYAQVPVQVIQPTRDRYLLPAFAEGLSRWVPRLWLRRLASPHWAPLTRPAQVTRMITEFVDHIEGAPAAPGLARSAVAPAAGTPAAREFGNHLVVVTGAGSGIGRTTALAFAGAGAEVVCADIDAESAKRTASAAGGYAYQVDVSDEAAMREFAASVAAEYGVPDTVVNNAGIGHSGTFLATTTEEWRRVLDVNLWGVIHGCRAFGELMVQRGEGGHIVNVSSVAAYLPVKILAAYATSKAAVFMLSDCLRAELAGHDIGVSTICPGIVDTNITRTSTFSGLSEAEQAARQSKAASLYARRGFGPERVAREILKAVRQGTPVVPVTPEAKVARLLSRISPASLRAAARIDVV